MTSQAKRRSRRDYADQLFSKWIRARDGVCQMAGPDCFGGLQAAHFIPRGPPYTTRWHPDNAAALCIKHHHALDADPIGRHAWFSERLGEDKLKALHELSRERWHGSYERVLAEIKALQE